MSVYAAGVEVGGMSASVGISDKLGSIIWKKKGIPTAEGVTPEESVQMMIDGLKNCGHKFNKIGIASFGPLDLQKGCIGNTPKPKWGGFPIVDRFKKAFPGVEVILETDVNAPAYSEFLKFAETDKTVASLAYVTVGTGVGIGCYCDNRLIHGALHPEGGHVMPQRVPGDENFEGICRFHKNCYEGLISSHAIAKRKGFKAEDIRDMKNDDPVWDVYCKYIAQMAAAAACMYSIDYFVIGGGITTAPGREFLYEKIQKECENYINGYLKVPKIVRPNFNTDSGLVGACALALR